MRIGIAADHAGFAPKQELIKDLRAAGHEMVDYGAHRLDPHDDYPDFVGSLAKGVARGEVERGIAVCGCLGGRVIGYALAWELIQTFLAARFTGEERHKRRLRKIAALEEGRA